MATPCEQIAASMGALFECSQINRYTRIRTPFLYPDGDVIDLYWDEQDGNITITDLGGSLGWLSMQTASPKKTAKQRRLIQDICTNHGIEQYRGMLMLRVKPGDDVADKVSRLSQAVIRVTDLWFTFRHRAVQSITDEVGEFLGEKSIRYDRGERLPGRSGNIWKVDFHTRTASKSSLVNVLCSGSKAAAHKVTEHIVTLWHDLSHLNLGEESLQFVSLLDDTVDVWTDEDIKLVSELSDLSYWSRPDEFAERLVA